jgi:hypothetical protein
MRLSQNFINQIIKTSTFLNSNIKINFPRVQVCKAHRGVKLQLDSFLTSQTRLKKVVDFMPPTLYPGEKTFSTL